MNIFDLACIWIIYNLEEDLTEVEKYQVHKRLKGIKQ